MLHYSDGILNASAYNDDTSAIIASTIYRDLCFVIAYDQYDI